MIERLLFAAVKEIRDLLAILYLRPEITRLKLINYDLLVNNIRGLRRALETQKRAQDDLHRQLEARDAQIKKLQEEYIALESRRSEEGKASTRSERLALFKRLQPILTQLPTLRLAVEDGGDITAHDVLDILVPLDEMIRDWGLETIGEAGERVRYDPQRHRAVGRGARSVSPDDVVRVRYVGYLCDGEVVCKAEVTCVKQD